MNDAPFITHLAELKTRFIRALLVWLAATVFCYFYAAEIYQFLLAPLAEAFGGESGRKLIATSLTETFVTYIKLAIYGGFFLAFPYIAAEIYLFVAPGLYKKERGVLLPYLLAAPLLFAAGTAFAYFLVIPKAWQFFVSFETGGTLPIVLEAKVSEYLGLVMQLVLAFGLSFQLPVALTLLVRTGLVSVNVLARGRRYAVVILLTIAAFITPPDILSQVLLFIPLYALYECSILIGRAVEKKRAEYELEHA